MPGKLENTCDWIYNRSKKGVAVTYNAAAGAAVKAVTAADKLTGGKVKDAAGVTAAAVTTKAAFLPALGAFGFGSGGPVAGSYAAGFMSSYGAAVPAGSACALLQSLSMGGIVLGLTPFAAAATSSYLVVKGVQSYRGKKPPPQDKP